MTSRRVLVADDHVATRREVRAALEASGFEVCADVGTADAATQAALEHRPDVCLLDVLMPGGGIAAARSISRALPETAIVMLTVSREDDHLFDALKGGAIGYLLKDIAHERIGPALEGVLAGEAALPRTLTVRLIDEFRRRQGRRLALPDGATRLTEREMEVLELMRDGLSTREIGERMYVAPVTVRSHVAAILKKLRVSSRDEAVEMFGGASAEA